jgi:hypothetical protein
MNFGACRTIAYNIVELVLELVFLDSQKKREREPRIPDVVSPKNK